MFTVALQQRETRKEHPYAGPTYKTVIVRKRNENCEYAVPALRLSTRSRANTVFQRCLAYVSHLFHPDYPFQRSADLVRRFMRAQRTAGRLFNLWPHTPVKPNLKQAAV